MSVSVGSSNSDGRKLVVCCAAGDRAQLEPAFDVLGAKGFDIAIVDGAEVRTPTLIEQIRRHGTQATYVVATSPELDDTRAARLMTVLRSTDVPSDRIVKVEVDWRDPMALLQALDKSRTSPTPKSVSRPVTGPNAPVLRKRSPSRVAGRREQTGPRPTVAVQPKATGPRTTVAVRPERTGSKVPTGPHQAPPPPKLSSRARKIEPAPKPSPSTVKPLPDRVRTHSTAASPPVADQRQPVSAEEPVFPEPTEPTEPSEPTPDPAAHEQPFTALGNLPTPSLTDAPLEAASGPAKRPERPVASPKPRLSRGVQQLRVVTASLRPLAMATGHRMRDAARWLVGTRARLAIAGGTAGVALCVVAVASIVGGESDPRPDDQAQPTTSEPAEADETTPDEDDASDEEKGPSPQEMIAQAQARQELGIAEGIVYAPLDPPKGDFETALAACDNSTVAGLSGWRLPTLSELHTLAMAKAVEWGPYWSGTEADQFGTRALIWNEKKSRAAPIGKRWRGARALCVLDIEPP